MTREEEIHNMANTISPDIGKEIDEDYICNDVYDFTIGFKCGVKWADKTMLEKACEWLENCAVVDIEEFKKAMEGFKQCIPYKDNEHLLGTTDDCDDFYKTW